MELRWYPFSLALVQLEDVNRLALGQLNILHSRPKLRTDLVGGREKERRGRDEGEQGRYE